MVTQASRTFPGLATVTLQGGGLFGLALLGQLHALQLRRDIYPLAYMGNSAGGIVAALAWADVSAATVRDHLAAMADRRPPGERLSGLLRILGPFGAEAGGPGETPKQLGKRRRKLAGWVGTLFSEPDDAHWIERLYAWGRVSLHAFRHRQLARSLASRLGVYEGRGLEDAIDELIRNHSRRPELLREAPVDQRIRVFHLQRDATPALFLTAFDLNEGAPWLFSSFDRRLDDLPVASAARASGSFPLFFKPVRHRIGSTIHRFIDGGVATNFPIWASGHLRAKLTRSLEDAKMARLPMIHFGLRRASDASSVVIDDDPKAFATVLKDTLTGGTRDLYEDHLEQSFPNAWVLRQPSQDLKWPYHFLDFGKVTGNGIRHLFDRGHRWAENALRSFNLAYPDEWRDEIAAMLDDVCVRVDALLGPLGVRMPRASLFLPTIDLQLMCAYSRSNAGDNRDREAELVLELDQGLVGAVFMSGVPMVADIRRNDYAYGVTDRNEVFERSPIVGNAASQIEPGRAFALAVPLFAQHADEPVPLLRSDESGAPASASPRARYGIVSLDVVADDRYIVRPEILKNDRHVRGIVNIMEVTARDLARIVVPAAMGRKGIT